MSSLETGTEKWIAAKIARPKRFVKFRKHDWQWNSYRRLEQCSYCFSAPPMSRRKKRQQLPKRGCPNGNFFF